MRFLQPFAWWLLLALPLIILLHLMRLRRRPVLVPSLQLWEDAPEDVRASTPSRRFRLSLLLVLQTAAFLLLVAALARPYVPLPGQRADRIVAVLDLSGSMQGTDVSPTRFDAARQALKGLLDDVPRRTRIALIAAGRTPELLVPFTGDRSVLAAALDVLDPTDVRADLDAAVRLAEAISTDVESEIHLFTDMDVAPRSERVVVHRFIGENRNVLIERFAVTRSGATPTRFLAVVRIRNETDTLVRGHVFLEVENVPIDSRAVVLDPKGVETVEWEGAADPDRATAFVATLRIRDDLPSDNRAYAVLPPFQPLRVLVVGERNPFLDALLALNPPIVREWVPSDAYLERDDIDLTIFENVLPDRLPKGELLFIDPPGALPFATPSGRFRPKSIEVDRTHPLTRFVDFSGLAIREATVFVTTREVVPLLFAEGRLLLGLAEDEDHRSIFSAFDLFDPSTTDFALRPGAVVFFSNWIGSIRERRQVAPSGIRAGDIVRLRVPDAGSVTVIASNGARGSVLEGRTVRVERAGIYEVLVDGEPFGRFSVDPALDQAPSDNTDQGKAPPQTVNTPPTGRQELWQWFAAVALGLLFVEWWVVQRRT